MKLKREDIDTCRDTSRILISCKQKFGVGRIWELPNSVASKYLLGNSAVYIVPILSANVGRYVFAFHTFLFSAIILDTQTWFYCFLDCWCIIPCVLDLIGLFSPLSLPSFDIFFGFWFTFILLYVPEFALFNFLLIEKELGCKRSFWQFPEVPASNLCDSGQRLYLWYWRKEHDCDGNYSYLWSIPS